MKKLEDGKSSNGRRLMLGYDGGCLSCSILAQKIYQHVGDKLGVENLRDERITEWRKQVLGEDAPWGPTLFEVDGERALKAWTGLRMGLALARALGPVDTWRVMQAIGEMRPTSEKQFPGGLSRGQFLTGLGGAALVTTVLSGTGRLASPVDAEEAKGKWHEQHGSELVDTARKKAQTQDVINVAGQDWVDQMQNGEVIRKCFEVRNHHYCTIFIATGKNCDISKDRNNDRNKGKDEDHGGNSIENYSVRGNCTGVKAGRRALNDNNSVLSIAWGVPSDNRIIHYREYEKPVRLRKNGPKSTKAIAKLYKTGHKGKKMKLEEVSINGISRRVRSLKK